jgi:hypothetical protein
MPLLVFLLSISGALPQNLLPNPGFEGGSDQPVGWKTPKHATWSNQAFRGQRALRVEGTGQDSGAWQSQPIALDPGGLYRLSFMARRDADGSGGCIVSGPTRVNRDFRPDEFWSPYSFIFCVPHDWTSEPVRLGHWEAKGGVAFDDAELLPVKATHRQGPNGITLGEGERIEKGVYHFQPDFGWRGANFHRPLHTNRLAFNSDRWCFAPGSELTYRFAVPGSKQMRGAVRVTVNHYVAGTLRIEASPDGRSWMLAGLCTGQQRATNATLPVALFPSAEIFVRLSTPNDSASLQVNAFEYEAELDQSVEDLRGQTWFVAVQQSVPEIRVELKSVWPEASHDGMESSWLLTNGGSRPLTVVASVKASPGEFREWPAQVVPQGEAIAWHMNCPVDRPGPITLETRFVDEAGRVLFAGTVDVLRSVLFDPRPGHGLTDDGQQPLWWCESGWKIGRDAPGPGRGEAGSGMVRVSAARGEDEAAQIIIPPKSATLVSAQVTPFRGGNGEDSPIQASLAEVVYLQVSHPTDSSCERGWYPDPLPPLRTPLKLPPHNQPLWVTIHVPRETKGGDYTGELVLAFEHGTARVPLAVHVYDFELPRETHLRSALGLGTQTINRYHGLATREQQQLVYDKYLANFAQHRISPYSFFAYSPIDVRFEGQEANKRAKLDFTRFDQAAAKWIDEARFNSFQLPLHGMGGGTFQSRYLGSLEGFREGTPEFARLFNDYLSQVAGHLRERGWLDEAFTYWFDEPDPKDYAFVVDGMERIRAAAPGLRRLLTEQPEKELLGHVEIWCGLTPEWTREKVAARRAAGEEVWWYVCTGPKAPYITLFIDHPAAEMRLWPWQSWQYGVQGLLVWETTYWSSSAAFPDPKLQDPWTDPMGYVSGYDYKPGHVGYWGNGDGRFLYPPRRDYLNDSRPCLEGPVNSVRWENLRDGMEDYEYFWLLEQAIKRVKALQRETDLTRQARELLKVPEEISRDLTHFTSDPRLLLAHRAKMAEMIERLRAF